MNRQHKKIGKRRQLSRVVSFFFHLKRNHLLLRRLAFLWIFLVVLEIVCPILECQDLRGFSSTEKTTAISFFEPTATDSVSTQSLAEETTFAIKENSSTEHCGDECLCHVTAVLGLNFDFPRVYTKFLPTLITYDKQPTVSISPPTQPPKNV